MGRFQSCAGHSLYYAYMGIAKVMHFERLILQIHKENEKLEVTASIWEDGTKLVSACHVAWTFTVWADLFQSRPLG